MSPDLVTHVQEAIQEATGYSVRGDQARAAAEAAVEATKEWMRRGWRERCVVSLPEKEPRG